MKRRRPHWEREELIQLFVLGAIASNPKLLKELKACAFTEPWASAVAALEKATKGDTHDLDEWCDSHLGVKRANGSKVVDAALERLRQDAVFREAKKVDELGAWQARVLAEMRDRQLRGNE